MRSGPRSSSSSARSPWFACCARASEPRTEGAAMSERVAGAGAEIGAVVAALYRSDSRKVLATLIRLLGDFDLAEEAVQDAFKAAVEQWPRDGVPANPV